MAKNETSLPAIDTLLANVRRRPVGYSLRREDGQNWLDHERGWTEGRGMRFYGFSRRRIRQIACEVGGRVISHVAVEMKGTSLRQIAERVAAAETRAARFERALRSISNAEGVDASEIASDALREECR
jgi:hypothetical protein